MRTIYKDFKGVNKGEWQRSVSQEQTMEDHQFQLDMTAIFFRDSKKMARICSGRVSVSAF